MGSSFQNASDWDFDEVRQRSSAEKPAKISPIDFNVFEASLPRMAPSPQEFLSVSLHNIFLVDVVSRFPSSKRLIVVPDPLLPHLAHFGALAA